MKQQIVNILIVVAAVFAPAKAMLLTVLALIAVDLITGVWAAKKQSIPITSAGLRRTVTKLFVYESAVALAFIVQQYLTGSAIPVANMVAGLIGITELLSCTENINIIGGNNLLQTVLDKLGSMNK